MENGAHGETFPLVQKTVVMAMRQGHVLVSVHLRGGLEVNAREKDLIVSGVKKNHVVAPCVTMIVVMCFKGTPSWCMKSAVMAIAWM